MNALSKNNSFTTIEIHAFSSQDPEVTYSGSPVLGWYVAWHACSSEDYHNREECWYFHSDGRWWNSMLGNDGEGLPGYFPTREASQAALDTAMVKLA